MSRTKFQLLIVDLHAGVGEGGGLTQVSGLASGAVVCCTQEVTVGILKFIQEPHSKAGGLAVVKSLHQKTRNTELCPRHRVAGTELEVSPI